MSTGSEVFCSFNPFPKEGGGGGGGGGGGAKESSPVKNYVTFQFTNFPEFSYPSVP